MRSMVASSMWPQPPPAAMTQAWPWRSAEGDDKVEECCTSLCSKCFRCFRPMLPVFHVDVAMLHMFYELQVFFIFMRDLNVPCNMKHILWWVFPHHLGWLITFFNIFWMLQMVIIHVTYVYFLCCKLYSLILQQTNGASNGSFSVRRPGTSSAIFETT